MSKELFKKDLYGILNVTEDATEKEILKGYRKKALKCHPDKNPDNPKAAELFHELSSALEILTDAAARAAYDQSRKAKKAADERNKVLDSKRKKFKEDLEAREQAAFEQSKKVDEVEAERKLQREIERLRKEGSRLLEQEQERLKEELKKATVQQEVDTDCSGECPRIKLKWQAKKGDPNNGGYNSQNLNDILSCYGTVSALIVSAKRNGSAIVEFGSPDVAVDILDETGLKDNPFSILWLSGKPTASHPAESRTESLNNDHFQVPNFCDSSVNFSNGGPEVRSTSSSVQDSLTEEKLTVDGDDDGGNKDFESLVLRRMRQAEERKRLIEQMMKEDENDT
ncbi:dnaJ homolog subfamily C member 17 [Aplysia californica]|uniref:DnaJ homolog subfamily C member 17 n=1 Tax=Aplysia californica TaxID=6500 RepID=A0ABM0K1A7_APLCA|nr:dnaJ homolog subfamily C member 17 [Aplysia californica]